MTQSNFFKQVRRSELEATQGREIPEMDVAEPQDKPEEKVARAAQAKPGSADPSPEDQATEEQQQQLEEERFQTIQQPDPETPGIVTKVAADAKPANIRTEEAFSFPESPTVESEQTNLSSVSEVAEQVETEAEIEQQQRVAETFRNLLKPTEEFIRQAEGDVKNPNVPTYAQETPFMLEFDTDTASADFSVDESSTLVPFNWHFKNSSNIHSPVVSMLYSKGQTPRATMSRGPREELDVDLVADKNKGPKLDYGGIKKRSQQTTDFTVDNVTTEEEQQEQNFEVDRGSNINVEDEDVENKETRQVQAENRNFISKMTPRNFGSAVAEGIKNAVNGEGGVVEEFQEGFQKGFDDPELEQGEALISPSKSLTGVLASGMELTSDITSSFFKAGGEGSIFAPDDADDGPTDTAGSDFLPNDEPTDETGKSMAKRFQENSQDNFASSVVLNQVAQDVPRDGEKDQMDLFDWSFGEFGKGTLGAINYALNLPQNMAMATANKLYDMASGGSADGENVLQDAFLGSDYTFLGSQSENKTLITPIAKDKEDRNFWQWAGALAGDFILGGFIEGGIGLATGAASNAAKSAKMAKNFPNKSPDFVSDVSPKVTTTPTPEFDGSIKFKGEKPNPLVSNPKEDNPERAELVPDDKQISSNKREQPTAKSVEPEADIEIIVTPTKEKASTEVDESGKQVKVREWLLSDDTDSAQISVQAYGNPKTVGLLPENSTPKEKGLYKDTREQQVEKQAKSDSTKARRQRTNADAQGETPSDVNDVTEEGNTYQQQKDDVMDVRVLDYPKTAAQKLDVDRKNPLPALEKKKVERTREQLTELAKRYGHVRKGRTKPLSDGELKQLREEHGLLYSQKGKELSDNLSETAAEIQVEPFDPATGSSGTYARLFEPKQDADVEADFKKLEALGENETARQLRIREQAQQIRSLRQNAEAKAKENQVRRFEQMLKDKRAQVERASQEVQSAESSGQATKSLEKYQKRAQEYERALNVAEPESIARHQRDTTMPRDMENASDENLSRKVKNERTADMESSEARIQQSEAEAAKRVRAGREKALDERPEGMERLNFADEVEALEYDVSAGEVLRQIDDETFQARKAQLKPEAEDLKKTDFYHGTQVNIQRLPNSSDNLFSAIDPDSGGSATEIGIGLHLTDRPKVAEEYAKSFPPPNRPNLDDVEYLPRGQVFKVGAVTDTPIRADIATSNLPDEGKDIRQIFKDVGEIHSPNQQFATNYKRSIRTERSIQDYFDQFRTQLAEQGELTEQRVREFQKDVTQNLRIRGYDALYRVNEQGNRDVNLLNPEQAQTISKQAEVGDADELDMKGSRRFVDSLIDDEVANNTTRANKLQSDVAESSAIEEASETAQTEASERAWDAQEEANEASREAFNESLDAEELARQDAIRQLEDEVNDLVDAEWNPDEPVDDFLDEADDNWDALKRYLNNCTFDDE